MASTGTNIGEWAQTEGTQGQMSTSSARVHMRSSSRNSSSRHTLRECEVEQAQMSTNQEWVESNKWQVVGWTWGWIIIWSCVYWSVLHDVTVDYASALVIKLHHGAPPAHWDFLHFKFKNRGMNDRWGSTMRGGGAQVRARRAQMAAGRAQWGPGCRWQWWHHCWCQHMAPWPSPVTAPPPPCASTYPDISSFFFTVFRCVFLQTIYIFMHAPAVYQSSTDTVV